MPRIYHRSTLRLDQAKRRRFIETFRRQALLEDWIPRPPRGWLAEIRTVSGVSTRDLATRLKIDQSVVVRAEASERKRTLTLAALERYADALDADVHYFLVPRAGLQAQLDSKGRRRQQQLRVRASPKRAMAASPSALDILALRTNDAR